MASWFPLVDESQNVQNMVNLGKQVLQEKDPHNCDDVSGKSKCISGMRLFKCITMDRVEDSGSVPMCYRSCVTENVYWVLSLGPAV